MASAGVVGGPAASRLVVDADAELHLAFGQLEGRLPRGGDGASREGHAHGRAHLGGNPPDRGNSRKQRQLEAPLQEFIDRLGDLLAQAGLATRGRAALGHGLRPLLRMRAPVGGQEGPALLG
jgi:hypothetical protein